MTQAESRSLVQSALERIKTHPFLREAEDGKATIEQIHRWIFCAGRESRSFPNILTGLLDWTSHDLVRSTLAANLDDELGNGNPEEAHYRHYLRLLDEMAIGRERFDEYPEGPGIRAALQIAKFASTCRNEALALGYLLINEAMTPCIYGAVASCLRALGILPETRFFQLHVDGDIIHVDLLYKAVESYHDTGSDFIDGIGLGERGMAILLDEVYGTLALPATAATN